MSMGKASAAVFALHSLLSIQSGDPVTLVRLNEHSGVSISYLEQIFAGLRLAGWVVSTRGPGGGYTVNGDITVGDVVRVFVKKGILLAAPVLTALDGVRIVDLPEGVSL